ncbi:uncharacterized protein LOC114935244 [Nylanderia fulva]|uniref:uncharacterized protein LOC114932928 n=1 Tax=Nylanderia fulva TaxID=613905 RepID=UPI0010FB6EA5|nr:uncharacterized protein LOC114932928 [Nylanderia fulva]XP_029163836.1 uncharacterized protein LOC114935244 [Nylanderia fulva]
MDRMVKQQTLVAGYIIRMWVNLQKIGQAKITENEVSTRLARLDDYWTRYQNAHFEIVSDPEADKTAYMRDDCFTTTEEAYFRMRSKLDLRDQLKKAGNIETEARSGPSSTAVAPVLKQMQLPKLELPKFSGDQLEWEGFRNLFRSLVHDVTGVPKVQKLQYLMGCLTGEAAEVVAGVPLTDGAYDGAWQDLIMRYDNQRVLLCVHMRHLISCPAAVKSSATEIKRLLGVLNQARRALASLGRPVESWDDWFVHLLVSKLDATTRMHWETSLLHSRDFPTFLQLQVYLENRVRALEAARVDAPLPRGGPGVSAKSPAKPTRVACNTAVTPKSKAKTCTLCQGTHTLTFCPKYKALPVTQRAEQVKNLGACLNCVKPGHRADSCPGSGRCLVCGATHHTTLHGLNFRQTGGASKDQTRTTEDPVADANSLSARISSAVATSGKTVLLATAQILLEGPSGRQLTVRALLDTGSEASFITKSAAQLLRASRRRVRVAVNGLQGTRTGEAAIAVDLTLRSRTDATFHLETEAFVLRRLTDLLPPKRVAARPWPHLANLSLADPDFATPAAVDVVLSADVYRRVMRPDSRQGSPDSLSAHLSAFGWVLLGAVDLEGNASVAAHTVTVLLTQPTDELSATLKRQWELEEVAVQRLPTPDEDQAEEHFKNTHSRDASGRYVVRLPNRPDRLDQLGESRSAALSMLLGSERRLAKKPELQKRYTDFMVEYLALDHMNPVPVDAPCPSASYYLFHHAVFKAGGPAGKIRVVFNASFKTNSGYSLNDCLLAGPRLQTDLWVILTRWRRPKVGFMADIIKMFRQIRVNEADVDLQRILWRAGPAESVREFQLRTVTYGTTSAPFLAIRTLQQLARDEAVRFPLGATALLRHSYVDDILAGGDDLTATQEIQRQLVALLQAGGFALDKWASNARDLLPQASSGKALLPAFDAVSALGIVWHPDEDALSVRVAAL